MKKVVIASVLAIVSAGTLCTIPALALPIGSAAQSSSGSNSGSITIKNPAEYNAYENAMSQTSPAAKAAAIEQFLKQYPNSVVKKEMLAQLVAAYRATGNTAETLTAAKRLLKVEPENIRALAFVAFVSKSNAGTDVAKLNEAASYAQQGLKAPKPADMTEAQYSGLKPLFLDVIGASQQAQKDYKSAIQTYLEELHAFSDPNTDTQKGIGLYDTYNLANAYVQQDPKDVVSAIWYFTRAAQFLTGNFQQTAEKSAKYWYQTYHGSMSGYNAIVSMAKTSLFPPSTYTITKYVPPTPEQLAHQAVLNTPNLATLSLHDKEYILKNGSTDDASKVWDVLKGKVAEVPGVVISATADSVQLAVSPDAQNSNTADFTVNMKKPLKKVPNPGDKATYIATFASYTQSPLMIIMNDGIVKPVMKARPPVRRGAHHYRR
jgi:tetratricopeptide (TPR) repeat protein